MKNVITCPDCGKLMIYNKELGYYEHIKPTRCKSKYDRNGVNLNDKFAEDDEYQRSKLRPEDFENEIF